MTRGLDPAIQAHLDSRRIKPIYLVNADFQDGIIYLTNYCRDIEFGGQTYIAGGSLLSFDGIQESLELEAAQASITLSGIGQGVQALVLEQNFVNNPLQVYTAFLDSNDQIIDEPFLTFEGKMDGMTFTDDFENGTSTVSIPLTSQWARFDDINGRKSNPREQKTLFPGDTFFDLVPKLVEKNLYF